MKKLFIAIFALLFLSFAPVLVSAQSVQQQQRVQDPATHETTTTPQAVQNQNQIQVQNQGEEQQLMTATQQMQQLINLEGLGEEVGDQVKTIAQQQVQTQTQIQTQLNKLNSRSNLVKKLIGPDYSALKNLNQHMQENQTRIQQLQMLANQAQNKGEETQLQEAIRALVQQNTTLQTRIQAEEKVGSIFGWLFKLFNQ